MGSIFFLSFLERDAFDALFDNAPEKLNVVKKVYICNLIFVKLRQPLKYSTIRYMK